MWKRRTLASEFGVVNNPNFFEICSSLVGRGARLLLVTFVSNICKQGLTVYQFDIVFIFSYYGHVL